MFMFMDLQQTTKFANFPFSCLSCLHGRHITKNETIVIDTQHVLKLKTHKQKDVTNDDKSESHLRHCPFRLRLWRSTIRRRRAHHARHRFRASFHVVSTLRQAHGSDGIDAQPSSTTCAVVRHRAMSTTASAATAATSRQCHAKALPSALQQTLDSHVDVDRSTPIATRPSSRTECVSSFPADNKKGAHWEAIPLVSSEHVVLDKHVSRADGGVPEHFFAIDNDEHKLFVSVQRHHDSFALEFSVYAMVGKQFKTHAITVQSGTPFESMTLRFVDRAEHFQSRICRCRCAPSCTTTAPTSITVCTLISVDQRRDHLARRAQPSSSTTRPTTSHRRRARFRRRRSRRCSRWPTTTFRASPPSRTRSATVIATTTLRSRSLARTCASPASPASAWRAGTSPTTTNADGTRRARAAAQSGADVRPIALVLRTEARVAESDTFELPVVKPLHLQSRARANRRGDEQEHGRDRRGQRGGRGDDQPTATSRPSSRCSRIDRSCSRTRSCTPT
jgi:hypothetical protein